MKTRTLFLHIFLVIAFFSQVNAQTVASTQPVKFSMAYDSLKVNLANIPTQFQEKQTRNRHFGKRYQNDAFFVSDLFPNNAADNTCLEIKTPVSKAVKLCLYDVNDKVIATLYLTLESGMNRIPIHLYDIDNGFYTVGVKFPGGRWNYRSLLVGKG